MLSCTYRTQTNHIMRRGSDWRRSEDKRWYVVSNISRASVLTTAKPHIHSSASEKKKKKKEIKCRFGMNSLYAACTDNSLTVGFKERLGTWREVSGEGENHKKWFSHAHHTALVFINPYCTSLPHLKQTLARTLQLTSKSELVLLCHPQKWDVCPNDWQPYYADGRAGVWIFSRRRVAPVSHQVTGGGKLMCRLNEIISFQNLIFLTSCWLKK